MPHAGVGTMSLRLAPLGLAWLTAVPAAHAQTALATVTTTANGSASITVQPGTPVQLSVSISHNQFKVAGFMGGTVVDGHAGTPSNFSTTIPSLPTAFFGSFVGGSRIGADIATPPPGFGTPDPPFGQHPMPVWKYDLTIDQPGTYAVNWVAPAIAPNVRLFPTIGSFNFVEARTTYVGATITVVPSPASLALLALYPVTTHRRRRRANGGR